MKPKRSRRKWIHGRHKWVVKDRLELPPTIRPDDPPEPDYPRINGGKRKRKKSPILPFELQKVPKLGRKLKLTVQAYCRREQGLVTRRSRVRDPEALKNYCDFQFWKKLREIEKQSLTV